MLKKIIFTLVMFASLLGGIYIAITFYSAYKLLSLILFGCFYGILRQKITGKW